MVALPLKTWLSFHLFFEISQILENEYFVGKGEKFLGVLYLLYKIMIFISMLSLVSEWSTA
jgi:hypothetical protein